MSQLLFLGGLLVVLGFALFLVFLFYSKQFLELLFQLFLSQCHSFQGHSICFRNFWVEVDNLILVSVMQFVVLDLIKSGV